MVAHQPFGFESDISHNEPDTLCRIIVIKYKISGKRGKPTPEAKKIFKKMSSPIKCKF